MPLSLGLSLGIPGVPMVVSPAPSGTDIYDEFLRGPTGNPGATINGTTPDQSNVGGGSWILEAGAMNTAQPTTGNLVGGRVYAASAAAFNSIRLQTSDELLEIEGVIERGFSSGTPYITINPMHQDANNSWWCYFNRNGAQRIYKRVGGTLTLLASKTGYTYDSGVERFFRVRFDGTTISASIFTDNEGLGTESLLQYTLTGGDASLQSFKNLGVSCFDNNVPNVNNVGLKFLKARPA